MMQATEVSTENIDQYIGKDMGCGNWFKVDQQRINDFADTTLDHQFIHVDPEKARQTPFGGTIAHGFLSLSLMVHLTEGLTIAPKEMVMGVNYGFDKIRFLAPVKVNDEIRARVVIADIQHKDNKQLLIKQEVTVEIKGNDKPALVCEWLALLICG